jgi:TP901 family phage tail tape measure protein
MPAADAATCLHMAISLMMAPSGQAQTALEGIGMTQFQVANDMRSRGLLPALKTSMTDWWTRAKQQTSRQAVLSQAFGGGRSAGAIELLLNNLDRVGQKYQLIDEGVNKFGDDVQMQSETAAAKFAEAQAQMADASIKLGAALLPLIHRLPPSRLSLACRCNET